VRVLLRLGLILIGITGPASLCAAPGLADEWVLRGTLAGGTPDGGIAIVEHLQSHQQTPVKVGDLLVEGIRLNAVYADHARVQTGDHVYRLDFGQRVRDVLGQNDGRYRLKWDELPAMLERLELIPHQQDGRVVGYYANRIDDEIREGIGLQPGDLLLKINGLPLDGTLDPLTLYASLQNATVQVEVKRQGRRIQLAYEIR